MHSEHTRSVDLNLSWGIGRLNEEGGEKEKKRKIFQRYLNNEEQRVLSPKHFKRVATIRQSWYFEVCLFFLFFFTEELAQGCEATSDSHA